MITLIRPDETVEVIDGIPAREWLVENFSLPLLISDWRTYGEGFCRAWTDILAPREFNLDATALYLLSSAPRISDISDYYIFGPVAIVQEK